MDTLQITRMGIYAPVRVEFEVSADGKTFTAVATAKSTVDEKQAGPVIVRLVAADRNSAARYVRVKAISRGTIPAGHPTSAGAKAWLFVGEILVNPKAP